MRWQSTYFMLRKCFELKDAVNRFQRQMGAASRLDDLDTSEDEVAESEDDNEDELPVKSARARASILYGPLTDAISEDEWKRWNGFWTSLIGIYEMTQRLEGKSESVYLWITIADDNRSPALRESAR